MVVSILGLEGEIRSQFQCPAHLVDVHELIRALVAADPNPRRCAQALIVFPEANMTKRKEKT